MKENYAISVPALAAVLAEVNAHTIAQDIVILAPVLVNRVPPNAIITVKALVKDVKVHVRKSVHQYAKPLVVDARRALRHALVDAHLNVMAALTPVQVSVQEVAVIAVWDNVPDAVNRVHQNVVAVQEAAVCNVLSSVVIAVVINVVMAVANHV